MYINAFFFLLAWLVWWNVMWYDRWFITVNWRGQKPTSKSVSFVYSVWVIYRYVHMVFIITIIHSQMQIINQTS